MTKDPATSVRPGDRPSPTDPTDPTHPTGTADPTDTADPTGTADPADTAAIAARLRLSATRLARRLRQQAGSGLTPSQQSALAAIECNGPLTLGALADHERVSPPTITRVVGILESEGLVTRAPDPTDRRVVHVAVTRKGVKLLADTRRRRTAWLAERIGHLDDDQRRRLADALDVLEELTTGETP